MSLFVEQMRETFAFAARQPSQSCSGRILRQFISIINQSIVFRFSTLFASLRGISPLTEVFFLAPNLSIFPHLAKRIAEAKFTTTILDLLF